jgi:hypothetical protein
LYYIPCQQIRHVEEFRYLILSHYGTTLNIYSNTIADMILEKLYHVVRPGQIKDLISKKIQQNNL